MSEMSQIRSATWYDKQFGRNGTGAYLVVMGGVLTPFFASALVLLRHEFKFHHLPTIPIGVALLLAIVFLYIEVMSVLMVLDGRKILQVIALENKSISGKFYFGRKIRFSISDIKSVSYYPLTRKTQWSHFLDAKSNKPGIDIVLNNGEQCRISPKMENFSDMVKTLNEEMVQHPHGGK